MSYQELYDVCEHNGIEVEEIVIGYAEAMLFDGSRDSLMNKGGDLRGYDVDFELTCLVRSVIMEFIDIVGVDVLKKAVEHANEVEVGRDVYFTSQGHGVGFWDGGWPEEIEDALTNAADYKYLPSEVRAHAVDFDSDDDYRVEVWGLESVEHFLPEQLEESS